MCVRSGKSADFGCPKPWRGFEGAARIGGYCYLSCGESLVCIADIIRVSAEKIAACGSSYRMYG
ncbi:hypothetical protein, partial [Pseudomonas sp. SDO5591_S426]